MHSSASAGIPFFGSVQDNPVVKQARQYEVGQTSLALTNVPGVPFAQKDWQNPRKASGTGITDFGAALPAHDDAMFANFFDARTYFHFL